MSDKSFAAEIFYFLGEVEVIFGIWVIPLFFSIIGFYNWKTAVAYIDERSYTEPIFVVIIMCLTATRPLVKLAENSMRRIAYAFGGTVSCWWFVILTLGPILGSFITEAGAMTLSGSFARAAVLSVQTFFKTRLHDHRSALCQRLHRWCFDQFCRATCFDRRKNAGTGPRGI